MSIVSRMIARMYKLPPADTYDISIARSLEIPMPDGVILRADRYYPRKASGLPTLLVRTPYGRSRLGMIWGYVFAERGFQVLIESCRGTDDSGGDISPFRGEGRDGLATIEWIKAQEWFDGRLGMAGPSYMGFTQWAVAYGAGAVLKAFCTQVTSSEFFSAIHPGGTFALEIFLQWIQITSSFKMSFLQYIRCAANMKRLMKAAVDHLPLLDADRIVVGEHKNYWRDWLDHSQPGDEWWAEDDFSQTVSEVAAPNHFISGWYDFLLPALLRDFASVDGAGHKPYLTIGPWAHSSNGLAETGLRESILWLQAHIFGRGGLRQAPVRVFVMGANEWRNLPSWPPCDTERQRWHLQPEAGLSLAVPADSPASRFRYDPAEPTPNVGGATNATLAKGTGAMDNRKLEARGDVLTFTGKPLQQDIEMIGAVSAELYVKSSLGHTDFFVRVCDVHPLGQSYNICDGILRLSPGNPAPEQDGVMRVTVELSATAYRFHAGHRIRVQVSSGAHPRYARNTGTGEPLATATVMMAADQLVFHDPIHPSAVLLPMLNKK